MTNINTKTETNSIKKTLWIAIPISIIVVLGLWTINLIVWWNAKEAERGTFGDMFGAVNALFSGFAFAGLIITILLQRKDLKAQHNSLETQIQELKVSNRALQAQQDELEQTRGVFEEQSKTQKLMQFEGTFFNMLELHQKRVDSMPALDEESNTSETLFEQTRKRLIRLDMKSESVKHAELLVVDSYQRIFNGKRRNHFSYYFRTLYRIFKLIDSNFQDAEEGELYAKIVRAQMSNDEIYTLFINAHTKLGNNFKTLIYKYNLVKHIHSIPMWPLYNHLAGLATMDESRYVGWKIVPKLTNLINSILIDKTSYVEHLGDKIILQGMYSKQGCRIILNDDLYYKYDQWDKGGKPGEIKQISIKEDFEFFSSLIEVAFYDLLVYKYFGLLYKFSKLDINSVITNKEDRNFLEVTINHNEGIQLSLPDL